MDNAEILKELIDEEAIAYVKEHEKEYDKLFDSYITTQRQTINIGGKEFVFGVDLSNSKDMTAYPPYYKNRKSCRNTKCQKSV